MRLEEHLKGLIELQSNHHYESHPRWIYHSHKFSYVNRSQVPKTAIKKIERVFSLLTQDFKNNYANAVVDKKAFDQLNVLEKRIREKTLEYKSKHGAVYLFFCKIFFGNINRLSHGLIQEIQKLKSRYKAETNEYVGNDTNNYLLNGNKDPCEDTQSFEESIEEPSPHIMNTSVLQPYEELLSPPVYENYIPRELNEKEKLEINRFKFFHIFAEKMKVDFDAIFLPTVNISSNEVKIGLRRKHNIDGVSQWFIDLLKQKNIPFQEKKCTQPHLGLEREVILSLEDAAKLIADVPGDGVETLSSLLGREIQVYHSYESHAWGNAPSVEDSLALTLAHLDPILDQTIPKNFHPHERENYALPLVSFDLHGMNISITEDNEGLKNLIEQLLGVKANILHNTEIYNGHAYAYEFKVPRNKVETVLEQLGLGTVPALKNTHFQLHEVYSSQQITYIQHLTHIKRYHSYTPSIDENNVVSSLEQSLQALVSNPGHVLPRVSIHPRGWISIKIPKGNEPYGNLLAQYLEVEKTHLHAGKFDAEIIIYGEKKTLGQETRLEKFLKKLELDKNLVFLNTLQKCLSIKDSSGLLYAEVEGELDLPGTISRTLAALHPSMKEILPSYLSTDAIQDDLSLPLVEIKHHFIGMSITIPKHLNSNLIDYNGKKITFGDYLSNVFDLEGVQRNGDYHLNIEMSRIRSFLEKDLGLRRITNQKYAKPFIKTFYNLFNVMNGSQQSKRGTVARWDLKNHDIAIPSNIPAYKDNEIMAALEKILKDHPKVNTILKSYEDTLKEVHLYNKLVNQTTLAYLRALTYELLNSETISLKHKQDIIVEISKEFYPGACLPGKLTKIQCAYQKLMNPVGGDDLTILLLKEVKQLKMDILTGLFADIQVRNDEDIGMMLGENERHHESVGVFAAANVLWGDELGLDPKMGRDNPLWDSRIYGRGLLETPGNRYKQDFKRQFEANVIETIFDNLRFEQDERGELLNLNLYREGLQKVLQEEGLNPLEIEEELERLLPKEPSEEVKKLLATHHADYDHYYHATENERREILKNLLADQGLDEEQLEERVDELNMNEGSYTLTKEAIELLLINYVGLLNP